MLSAHALLPTRACELGAEFRFSERVTGIMRRRGQVVGVRTDKGGYATETVINAAGAVGASRGRHGGARRAGPARQPRGRHHRAGGAVPDADGRRHPAGRRFDQLLLLPAHTGQVVFCITPDPPVVGTDRRETSAFLPMIARRMVDLMPRLANIKVRRTWRGLYPMTPDGSPIVGRARELEGYIHAVGMCGQGYMLGPGVGELLTRMLTGRGDRGRRYDAEGADALPGVRRD